ncbi:TonB-dependent siderophore receptor [Methylotenera sp.]|uniref:TonB-dependent receptor plug domain-containing protein n=1 Tax=Methylotenera sp. TaxID=2051956 RepID=UPI002487CC7A|nr:TonB-dependent receptor [Methylotenera sp.]MDI1297634.1 TonB-dependent receptor [Methylotenera sp.]
MINKLINKGFFTLSFVVLVSAGPLFAAEEKPIKEVSEDDYIGDVPRVLTVSRLSQSIADAPSAVTVIDKETIRASGIVDLPEIFRLVPGFYVGTNAGFVHNTNHVVSYHGMTTAYAGSMQVLVNGRSVYSPLYGGVQWSELPIAIADIDRIEITRGPNAASYGANSFFGVINIITQSPSDQVGASLSATYGNGRHEAFARYGAKQNDLSYRVTAGYRDDDGLDNRYDFKRTRLLNAQMDYRVDDKNNLEFELGLVNGDREDDQSLGRTRYFEPRVRSIENNYELIRWRHNVSDSSDLSLQAYHSFDRTKDVINSVNLVGLLPFATLLTPTLQVNNDIEMERYDVEAQHNFSISPILRGVWGASIRQDIMYSPYYLGTQNTDTFNLQRLFGHIEWRPIERVVLNMGAMLENNSFTDTDISPRASINFKLNPNQTIRFGISTALRTPNYLEDKFNTNIEVKTTSTPLQAQYIRGNSNLNPERIISKEIGYLGDFGKFSLDARVFYDNIHDYIKSDIDRTTPLLAVTSSGYVLIKQPTVYTNAGDVNVKGFEAQAKWHATKDTHLLFNYAYVNINADGNQTADTITMSMPRDTISALLTHRFSSEWDASYAYYQTSEVTALGDGNYVGLARRSDIRLARKFKAERISGEVSAVVENLFNEHYQEFADYNTLKRRARLNVRLDF